MTAAQRKRVYAAIHVDGGQLAGGPEAWRDLLASITPAAKRSCRDCTDGELLLLLDWIRFLLGRRAERPPMRVGGASSRQVAELARLAGVPPKGFAASPLGSAEWVSRVIRRPAPLAIAGEVSWELLTGGEATWLLTAWARCGHTAAPGAAPSAPPAPSCSD